MTHDFGQWIHMIGIGGAGMSGIARLLRDQGVMVSGSDLQPNEITEQLRELGAEIYQGHSPDHIGPGVDLVVISSAIPPDNCEVAAAAARNIPVIKRGQMLARLVNRYKGLAVAGAHGKTTTTAMLYTVLAECGLDPTFIVGGEIQGSKLHAHLGCSDYFVVEADESDASFLEIQPYAAIVTNIENDHLDFYKSVDRIRSAFSQFINQVQEGGFVVLYGDDPGIQAIQDSLAGHLIYYGETNRYEYHIEDWSTEGMGSICEVYRGQTRLGQMELSIPGKHNALNALAVTAVALELGQEFAPVQVALKKFPGAKRRFQVVASDEDVIIIDDYAHHPTEIRTTIAAARQVHPGRLLVVFQPHRFSRTRLLAKEFGGAFQSADVTIVTDIYAAGEKPEAGISGELIYEAIIQAGGDAVYCPTQKDCREYILGQLGSGDMLITMGAGDIWKTGLEIAAARGMTKR